MRTGNLPLLSTEPLRFDLPDADVRLWSQAFASDESDELLAALLTGIDWRQEDIVMFGEPRRVPRLVAWHGDPDAAYTYSGTAHEPLSWTPALQCIRERVQVLTGHAFNSVLLNRYRDGRDGMGWHADDERELGRDPAIASVSLGATRRFKLRHRRLRDAVATIDLAHGDLLLMAGPTQHAYVHAVPKTARAVDERVNLTFRLMVVR
jgi:alkylated DNA repair dioxygenase AlkB